jgi:hypothetical protein
MDFDDDSESWRGEAVTRPPIGCSGAYVLIPESELAAGGVRARLAMATAETYAVDMTHPTYGEPFQNYLVFSSPVALREIGLGNLDAERVFYNRYYWFRRFAKLHARCHGPNAAIEQQAFQLLENVPFDVDWQRIEALDARANE